MKLNEFDSFVELLNKLKELQTFGWIIDNISLQYAPKQINLRIVRDESNKKVEPIILDNNPLSIACYLEEHPDMVDKLSEVED